MRENHKRNAAASAAASWIGLAAWTATGRAKGQGFPPAATDADARRQLQLQQPRETWQRPSRKREPDAHLHESAPQTRRRLLDGESPCFRTDQLELRSADRYPLSVTVSLDDALMLNDRFSASLNRDTGWASRRIQGGPAPHAGTDGDVLRDSLPWGGARASLTFGRSACPPRRRDRRFEAPSVQQDRRGPPVQRWSLGVPVSAQSPAQTEVAEPGGLRCAKSDHLPLDCNSFFHATYLMKFSAPFLCTALFCAQAFAQTAPVTEAVEAAAPADAAASAPVPDAPKPTEPFRYSGVLTLAVDESIGEEGIQDSVLRIVTPTDRKKDVALMVVGALFGSLRTPVAKEDYKGDKVGAMLHPAGADLIKKLEPLVDGWTQLHTPKQPLKNALWIRKDRFQLVYGEGVDGDLVYDLKIEAALSRKPDSAGFFSQPRTVKCSRQEAGTKTTLAQWQADDYAKVKAASAAFVEACAKSFQENLDVLLSP